MSWLESHLLLMLVYAFLCGAFFALLWKSETKDRLRVFALVFAGMLVGALVVAWAMYPFPG